MQGATVDHEYIEMKIFTTLLMILAMTGNLFGQENDTAVLRKNGVKYVEHHSYMAIYGERADTCIEMKIWVNEDGLKEKDLLDHNCTGWDAVIENEYEYDEKRRLIKQLATHNGAMQSQINYKYNDNDDISEYELLSFAPMITVKSKNEYFYNKKGLPDSTHRTSIINTDTFYQKDLVTHNKAGMVSMMTTFDGEGKMLFSNQYIYDEDGMLSELNVEVTEPEYSYSKSIFTYNENGQLFSSTDTDAGATVQRWYNENGLLILATHYNQFGQTVKKVHYRYTYR